MPLRKMKQKKFKGIYEYYKESDVDKATTAYYMSVRGADGVARKVKADATTPEEAVVALAHYKVTRIKEPVIQNHKMTFTELADKFFDQRTTSNNAKEKRRFELHVAPVLGKKLINKISEDNIEDLQTMMKKKQVPSSRKKDAPLMDMSPKTINNITDIATRVMLWGYRHKEKYVKTEIGIIDKLEIDNERQRVFTKEEVDTIFASTDGNTRIFLMLLYYTAQRPESILRLQKKHIINNGILISAIKKQKSHSIPMSDKLEELLAPWIKNLNGDDYIVTQGKTPMPYQTISGRVSKLFKRLFNAGLDYKTDAMIWSSMYTFRHTALTNIYTNTEDINVAQAIANHSNAKMTQRYVKLSEKIKSNAVNSL